MSDFISPRAFAAMRRRCPDTADRFAARLSVEVPVLVNRWRLSDLVPLSGGALSAVCAARTASGDAVVLKFCEHPGVAAAELDQFAAWAATGARQRWPEVLDADLASGAFLMRRCGGVPSHKIFDPLSVTGGVLGEFLATVAASKPPPLVPSAHQLLSASLFASAAQLAEAELLPRWRAVYAQYCDALSELDAFPAVACHGDLWAGNVMADPSTVSVCVIDPAPVAAPVSFDVARVAADGWNGPGFSERVDRLCAAAGADRRSVERLAALLTCAQVFTFVRHRWALAPIAAGVADVAASLGLDVEPLDANPDQLGV